MIITVLGKRSRSSDEADTLVGSCRAKRRTTVSIAEDDKENHSHLALVVPSSFENTIIDENSIPTPDTPRHRDREALLKRCPVTPRHRVLVGGKVTTLRTPRTPGTPSSSFVKSVFNDAKRIFTRSVDSDGILIGREKEKSELESFVQSRVAAQQGGCLYVSGPPGTGKSAFVTQTCKGLVRTEQTTAKYAYINCMSVKSAKELYDLMAAELNLDDAVCQGFSVDALRKVFSTDSKDMSLVVLDEIDQLLSLDSSTLCRIFEWSFAPDSKFILVGIANALDLTDRFLPRLKAQNLKPALLPFLPYTAVEIAAVLSSRARSLLPADAVVKADFTPFLHSTAIQLISKKIASQSGDLRKAFDIALRAVELVEAETKEKFMKQEQPQSLPSPHPPSPTRLPLQETVNLSSPPPSATTTPQKANTTTTTALTALTPLTAPRATLAHIIRVTSATLSQAGASSRLTTLNLQQKAILCALVSLEARAATASLSTPLPTTTARSSSTMKSMSTGITQGGKSCTPTARKLFTPAASAKKDAAGGVSGAPTIRALYEAYTSLCTRDNVLHALSSTEFRDVVSNLETMSLVAAAVDGTPKTGSRAGAGAGAGLFASSLTGTPRSGGGSGRKKNVAVPVDERRIKAMVGVKDLVVAVEGVGRGVLRGMLDA